MVSRYYFVTLSFLPANAEAACGKPSALIDLSCTTSARSRISSATVPGRSGPPLARRVAFCLCRRSFRLWAVSHEMLLTAGMKELATHTRNCPHLALASSSYQCQLNLPQAPHEPLPPLYLYRSKKDLRRAHFPQFHYPEIHQQIE